MYDENEEELISELAVPKEVKGIPEHVHGSLL